MSLTMYCIISLMISLYLGIFVPNTQQSSILCNQSLLNNDDADPDSNLFNELDISCNYYLPSDVKNAIVKLELKNQLFILHVNARSLEKTLNILSILIKSYKC